MGVPATGTAFEEGMASFSHDILKIEMSGPQNEHFSVIDLPGLFRSKSPCALNFSILTTMFRADSWPDDQRRYGPCKANGIYLPQQPESNNPVCLPS